MDFGKVFGWLGSKLKKIVPFLWKSGVVQDFLEDIYPIALDIVEKVARMDLNNDGKYDHAFSEIKDRCVSIGKKYKDRLINLSIELAVNELKETGKI